MPALHHVSVALDDVKTWGLVLGAIADGDSVVLLDAAAQGLQIGVPDCVDTWLGLVDRKRRAAPATRWLLPSAEQFAVAVPLPSGFELVADEHWLALIIDNPRLLEWS